MRRISAEAGVTMGLITHHFRGSASLVAAAYESLATSYLDATAQVVGNVDAAPGARLRRFFESYYAPEVLDPGLFRIWLVFWSLMPQSPEIRAVHDVTSRRHRAALESLLRDLRRLPGVPPFRVASAASGLAALMDGLWVSISLNPAAFTPADAVARCEDWIAALTAGAFPTLRQPRTSPRPRQRERGRGRG